MLYSQPMPKNDCADSEFLHPDAVTGINLFNSGAYFEAHEALEEAWIHETGPIRNMYRGILQAAVVYLHIRRGNYRGALKVYHRCMRWLTPWPDQCRGVAVERLREDLRKAITEVRRLGPEGIDQFNHSFFKPVLWNENASVE